MICSSDDSEEPALIKTVHCDKLPTIFYAQVGTNASCMHMRDIFKKLYGLSCVAA